ncbi:MAG: GNAT family N-acetyltransferase [Clostridia bacterium]|nr:GNAT family N-acetyltransferase [Clostridia bacterium]
MPEHAQWRIVEIGGQIRQAVDRIIREEWGGPVVVSRGRALDTSTHRGFAWVEDEKVMGLITYDVIGEACEITVLTSLAEGRGIGTALIRATKERAHALGCKRLWLVTTNDNAHAIRFYQRQGFILAAAHIGAMEAARALKPSIPLTGMDGIPLRDELEFEMWM